MSEDSVSIPQQAVAPQEITDTERIIEMAEKIAASSGVPEKMREVVFKAAVQAFYYRRAFNWG